MLRFKRNMEERKLLAVRLGELTGIHPVYTRAPLYAYRVGSYMVDRDGDLYVDEEQADAQVLQTLLGEGMISGGEIVGEMDGTQSGPIEVQAGEIGNDAGTGISPQDIEAREDRGEEDTEMPHSTVEVETEEANEPGEAEAFAAGEEDAQPPITEDGIPLDLNIDLPIGRHTGVSLRNLVNLLYSRGDQVSKATGGKFGAEETLVEALKDDACTYSIANFLKTLNDFESQNGEALHSVRITEDKVSFCGFPIAPDKAHLTAFGQLAVLMNNQAIQQKRIQAKAVDTTNEKYALRIWLVRMGMGGDEYKASRKILMERLSGHTAFRTPADAEKAKEKAQKKRDELRAAKEAARLAAEAQENGSAADASPMDLQLMASGA